MASVEVVIGPTFEGRGVTPWFVGPVGWARYAADIVALKDAAKALGVTVVAAYQVNRAHSANDL